MALSQHLPEEAEESHENSVWIAGIPARIRTCHFLNTRSVTTWANFYFEQEQVLINK
jgi:hypothetical protein